MKKAIQVTLVVILVLGLGVSFLMLRKLGRKLDALQADYEKLSAQLVELSTDKPISAEEVENFHHNMDLLNDFYGHESTRSVAIAEQCYMLKQQGQMAASKIQSVLKQDPTREGPDRMEIITEDGEYYCFMFGSGSSRIYAIYRGADEKTPIYFVYE